MTPKHVLLAVLLGLLAVVPAQAGDLPVVYTVFNPFAPPFPFVLFIYDSPGFITTDTTVSAAQLAFINSLNDITSVQFILHSADSAHLGDEELDVFETNAPPEESRYFPTGTFESLGVTAALPGSFGAPNTRLSVATPEPFSLQLLGVGCSSAGTVERGMYDLVQHGRPRSTRGTSVSEIALVILAVSTSPQRKDAI